MTNESIVVCGSGIAGLAATLALARAGLHAGLVGPAQAVPDAEPDVYHPRVYAISVASQQFLASLGVWGMLDAARITAVAGMEVYGDARGRVELQAWPAQRQALAWLVDSNDPTDVLAPAVRRCGVHWPRETLQRHQT